MKKLVLAFMLLAMPLWEPVAQSEPNVYMALTDACDRYGFPYIVAESMLYAESQGKRYCKEYSSSGKVISFGLMQVCKASGRAWFKHIGMNIPEKELEESLFIYSSYIAVYHLGQYLEVWNGDVAKAASCHNMGMTGFRQWRARNVYAAYYPPYIKLVKRELRRRYGAKAEVHLFRKYKPLSKKN